MIIQQWLGFNEESSQYLLRRGELRALVNLQPRRPGMLISRQGIIKLYGKYDNEKIAGLYRRDTLVDQPNDFLCLHRATVDRQLTVAQINAGELPQEEAWIIRRIQGYQERVIAQLPITAISGSEIKNFSIAEDRHGRLFIFFGNGAPPLMYRPPSLSNVAIPMGLEAPMVAPSVTPTGTGHFIESIDVLQGGGAYYAPPTITVSGGNPDREAKVKGIVQGGNLVGIDVVDGGANFKSFPKVEVSSDKIGAGFRAVGNLETDPGVQGFVSTTPGSISGSTPSSTETVGATNSVVGNRIMYSSSELVASTRTVALAAPSAIPPDFVSNVGLDLDIDNPRATNPTNTKYMLVESIDGILPGDLVTITPRSAYWATDAAPTNDMVVRVMGIDSRPKIMEGKTVRAIELSKFWRPDTDFSYAVQFRRDTDVGYANATWDATTKRFRASFPLRTIKGSGRGAQATLEFSPVAYSYGLGAFTQAGYTTPTGGVEPAKFAWKQSGWDSYINGDYWQGSFQDKKGSVENATYAGLQASGSSYVFGYSGDVTTKSGKKETNRRADVYWPDYSKISVWLCTGILSDNINQWTRVNAEVLNYGAGAGTPYALIDLKPTSASKVSSKNGKMSYSEALAGYGVTESFRYPKIKLKLKQCPDSWVTSTKTNGSFDYNLPTSVKESQSGRLAWWNAASGTPRPIVDVQRNLADQIAWDSIEVVDPGSGWENGTTFGLRIHQANAFDQKTDYNTAVRELAVSGAHQPFSTSSRFAQFVFKATEPDSTTPDGPPNTLAGSQYVDVSGTGYKVGDAATVQLLKRSVSAAAGAASTSFYAQLTGGGKQTEFTIASNVQQAGVTLLVVQGSRPTMTAGDVIECEEPYVLIPGTRLLRTVGTYEIHCDKMRNMRRDTWVDQYTTNVVLPTGDNRYYLQPMDFSNPSIPAATLTDFWTVGRMWRQTQETGAGAVVRVDAITQVSGSYFAQVTLLNGAFVAGAAVWLPILKFNVVTGLSPAQQVTFVAEQVVAGTGEQRVTSVRIVSGGRNYYAPPAVSVRGGGNGYGLAVRPLVSDGKITACEILDPGRAYTSQPELYTEGSPATAVPVMRPTMRGKYRCAYRFADRSETYLKFDQPCLITGVRGDSPTTVTLSVTEGIEPGMLVESDRVPNGTKVVSVSGAQVTLSQEAVGSGFLHTITIENGGSGYTLGETITASIAGTTTAVIAATREQNASGTYSVSGASFTNAGVTPFPVGRHAVTFSRPAGGGSPASGYAFIRDFAFLAGDADDANDATIRDMRKPVAYSNFSPIVDVDTGPNADREHCSELVWKLPGVRPPARADMVELWRTSSDQSLVFYRLEAYGTPGDGGVTLVGTDTLNDEELFDSDRPNYAAMPVVLPNGALNAYRFGVPRSDMAVCAAFQDRLWYASSTSGKDANTLYYSEFDEFESCPDVNDLPIQNNQRATDSITALVPFGSMLLAMQHLHTYAVAYNTDPAVDGSIQMVSHRGCLHQRAWDIHQNVLYAVDENGIYSMDRSGTVTPISSAIREWFNSELIDFSKRDSFFLTVCPRTHILRFFCCLAAQPEDTPTFALCYDVERQAWWTERSPNSFLSAVTGRPGITRTNATIFGGVDGNLYEFTGDKDHANGTLLNCTVTSGGKGYKRSPKVVCPSSSGVQLKAVVSEGRLVDVIIQSGGWDCNWGTQLLTESTTRLPATAGEYPPSGELVGSIQLMAHDGRLLQGVEYAPIVLDIDPPEEGGTQATAVASYSVTPRLIREVTVSDGESFVRMRVAPADQIELPPPVLMTTDGRYLAAKATPGTGSLDGALILSQPQPVEVGMEAIGDFLPLNCFVSKIVGPDIYLQHPDGTPISLLGGAARVDANGDGFFESGGSEATLYFRKPFYAHIPFRLATGAMQLINETNVNKGGDGLIDRSVTLVYSPTESKKEVEIVQYYNDSSTPRANVMRRSRGGPGGFEHRQDSASTVLDMQRAASSLSDATGVAKATFAGRVYADATGEDQHLQVEVIGRPAPANRATDLTPQKFVLHSMNVNGVLDMADG